MAIFRTEISPPIPVNSEGVIELPLVDSKRRPRKARQLRVGPECIEQKRVTNNSGKESIVVRDIWVARNGTASLERLVWSACLTEDRFEGFQKLIIDRVLQTPGEGYVVKAKNPFTGTLEANAAYFYLPNPA